MFSGKRGTLFFVIKKREQFYLYVRTIDWISFSITWCNVTFVFE
ncbi:hypothetical protein L248_1639 [Schleiferilactobacillus shenzhenensis LY-73]|uniref:Uncharacterized protein n=1 Tax=Schleiferilactobacillus shenzhenensis LY-73 TaxID=1231336 RepID=U4TH34_9LACO|nr:hypothetical protein L248_1639 [Schleiferilactobacillus shenzhenensis LY-73]